MKPARDWTEALQEVTPSEDVQRVEGRSGEPTLTVGKVYLHSRYRPREEAARLIESAGLDLERPVLVVGLGLGYHVLELVQRGADVVVVEPDPGVAKLALDGPLRESTVPLGIGEPEAVAATEGFRAFAARLPQVFVHPPFARVHPQLAQAFTSLVSKAALADRHLSVAVVGPMYGGSLPIAGYLEHAFRQLGHRTLFVDNSLGWELYETSTNSIKTKRAANQLGALLANFLNEWSYARVAEFAPDICIVLAQAPVNPQFPARLRKDGIVSAFWFVENWRHLPYWRDIAPCYDYFFHLQPGELERKLTETGCTHHAFVQTGCAPEVHRPVELTEEEREEFGCDISFAGAGYLNRVQMFRGLTDYDFKLWGVDWNASELRPLVQARGERFTPDRFARIVAGSKINLNLHSSTTHDGVDPRCDAINPRVFEIAACGGFQLCDPCIGLASFFDFGSELPVYRDLNELRDRIDYYLAHPDERRAIAQNARERALRDHTYANRAREMLDHILEAHGSRILRKGVRVQRTVSEMADRVGRGTPLGEYLASLPADLLFTYENISEQVSAASPPSTYPQAVFTYLREMRNTAEALLAAREE